MAEIRGINKSLVGAIVTLLLGWSSWITTEVISNRRQLATLENAIGRIEVAISKAEEANKEARDQIIRQLDRLDSRLETVVITRTGKP